MTGNITEKMVRDWMAENCPDLGVSRENGKLGFWRKRLGPAADFTTVGETWREVAVYLGMIEYRAPRRSVFNSPATAWEVDHNYPESL